MSFILPQRLKSGDKIAIVSPSYGLASLYPQVYQLGLKRIKEVFGLIPVEFPSAKADFNYLKNNPQFRAQDINDAFSDPEIKAILATTGGLEQIRILPYLNSNIIKNNPKIFLGYSDNTNIHLFLYKLGIISYYGCSVMSQFAMQGQMHDYTIDNIRKSLFEPKIDTISPSKYYTDYDFDWSDESTLNKNRPVKQNDGWTWHNKKAGTIQGRLWGGCLETLIMHLAIKTYLPDTFKDIILYVETSEEMPAAGEVYRFFATLGELGILQQLKAILVGKPKSQSLGMLPPEGPDSYIKNQKAFIVQALNDYKTNCPVIFDMNFGHTDPQILIPSGAFADINFDLEKLNLKYNH